jgi:hypothetical protein
MIVGIVDAAPDHLQRKKARIAPGLSSFLNCRPIVGRPH